MFPRFQTPNIHHRSPGATLKGFALRRLATLMLITGLGLLSTAVSAQTPPRFDQTGPLEVSEGHLFVSWSSREAPGTIFELEQARSAEFIEPILKYRGPENASYLSGLVEGDHFFRVRSFHAAGPSRWSQPLEVRTRYVGFGRVQILLGLGAVTFLVTLSVLLFSRHRKTPTPV